MLLLLFGGAVRRGVGLDAFFWWGSGDRRGASPSVVVLFIHHHLLPHLHPLCNCLFSRCFLPHQNNLTTSNCDDVYLVRCVRRGERPSKQVAVLFSGRAVAFKRFCWPLGTPVDSVLCVPALGCRSYCEWHWYLGLRFSFMWGLQ